MALLPADLHGLELPRKLLHKSHDVCGAVRRVVDCFGWEVKCTEAKILSLRVEVEKVLVADCAESADPVSGGLGGPGREVVVFDDVTELLVPFGDEDFAALRLVESDMLAWL